MIPYCILVIEDDDDRAFMTALYEDYKRLMFFEVRKIVKSEHDAEDIVQDVLEKLIDKITLLRSRTRDQVVNYIISTCKHTALNHNRDQAVQNETPYEDYIELPDHEHDRYAVELQMIKGEEAEALRRVLPRLDMRSQLLLEGYYFLDTPASELAEELGIRPDSVRMALTRARKKALALLRKEGITSL